MRFSSGVLAMFLAEAIAAHSDTPTKTDLYRYFDHRGQLLYVGVSKAALVRAMQHERLSHWWDSWAVMTRTMFPDRSSALAAERQAIKRERPLYNVIFASCPTHQEAP